MTTTKEKSEQAGDVKIITLGNYGGGGFDDSLVEDIARLKTTCSADHLLLDFTHVKNITSAELGMLVGLHKSIRASGGRLTLFNLNDQVFEVFAITRLETLLEICR